MLTVIPRGRTQTKRAQVTRGQPGNQPGASAKAHWWQGAPVTQPQHAGPPGAKHNATPHPRKCQTWLSRPRRDVLTTRRCGRQRRTTLRTPAAKLARAAPNRATNERSARRARTIEQYGRALPVARCSLAGSDTRLAPERPELECRWRNMKQKGLQLCGGLGCSRACATTAKHRRHFARVV